MRFDRRVIRLALAVAFLLPAVAATAEEGTPKNKAALKKVAEKDAVFDLEEFSVLETKGAREDYRFRLGQRESCSHEPDKTVKAYPKLKSEKPWHGSICFDRKRFKPDSGRVFHFVVDESEGTGKGYDLLYFDADQDLDLTNDPVLRPMKEPPPGAALLWKSKEMVVFDHLSVEFDQGPGLERRAIEMLPRLTVNTYKGEEYASLGFVPTIARRGKIRIGTREYQVVLGHAYMVMGRLDSPWAGLQLTPIGPVKDREGWWGADRLSGMRHVDGKWYSLTSTPTGDKLSVKPYDGDLGVFEIGPGERKIEKLLMSGSLRSEHVSVPVGDLSKISYRPELARRCTLPAGDYTFEFVHIEYGTLSISLSNNYHADGKPRGGTERLPVFGIKIRKDKPFVLDFSNEPEVMFASPARDQTFKPGEEVQVAAVLIDPVLDVMIRRLSCTEPVEEKKEEKDTAKKKGSLFDRIVEALGAKKPDQPAPAPRRPRSLDPMVTITDSSGKEVARGKMPFG